MTELSPLRIGRITGSRIGAILGLKGAFHTRAHTLRDMVREFHGLPDLFVSTPEVEHGVKNEGEAIMAYEAQTGYLVHGGQEIVLHPFYDFLAITPDGLVDDDGGVEVKAPYRARYTSIWEKPHYEAQLRLSIECTGRQWWDFGVWRPNKPLSISRVEFNPDWLPSVLPRLQAFMAEYEAAIRDPIVLARERGRGKSLEASDPAGLLSDTARWKVLVEDEIPTREAELEEIKARVGQQLGDNGVVTIEGKPVAKWRYRSARSVFDRASFKAAFADLEAEYSTTGAATQYPVLIGDDDDEGDET